MDSVPSSETLLRLWEQGRALSVIDRAVLLAAAAGQGSLHETARLSIGERDSRLLDLREGLFGGEMQCLIDCGDCGSTIEIAFAVSDIRMPHGNAESLHQIVVEGYEIGFRLPASEDLAELTGLSDTEAEQRLLLSCVLDARKESEDISAADLPNTATAAVSRRMSEVDAQAEILLDVACPVCGACSPAIFDIARHLWAELDVWAQRMLKEVHALAATYGWSEQDILKMNPVRRRAYIELIGA